jgi:two-component system sensor histidine kinase RpfC
VSAAAASLRRSVAALRERLAARPDTEHEQALVRIGMYLVTGLYMLPVLGERITPQWSEPHVVVGLGYLLASLALFASIVLTPVASPGRRLVGMVMDVSMLTWCMTFFDDHAVPFFLVYVWVTLANGFRFGPRALMISLALSVAGFSTVLALSEFWSEQRAAGVGLLIGFVMLSLYIRKLVTQLFDAVARAEAANQAKRRFISVVSHEMRTPLNAIIGMADLLRDTSLNREQADMLQTVRSASRMMLGLVEDVLDFSKIEAGKLALEKADFDLHALVNSTSRIIAAQAAAKNIEFVVSIMPEVPPALRGDPHYLRQVLVNLAGNAVKFTERGSVTLHVSAQRETETAVSLKFSIRDTGIGIAPEALKKIFDSFTQADQSTTRRFGGTGLGTTIAKQLVELMGGTIGVESAVGLGSTFWFELALEKQPERVSAVSGELAGARVLLVGFPEAERRALEQALSGWGAVAVPVESVDAGVARLVAEISLAKPYHSALLYAPGADLGLAKRFASSAPSPAPATVLAVSRDAGAVRFEALSAGFSAVLELPFEKRQLFNVLHSVSAGGEVAAGVLKLEDYARRGGALRRLQILVADDNPTNRQVIGKILERGGHEVTVVNDGEQALHAVEGRRFDLVILDRNMPGLGGIEALQAMRLITRGRPRIPAILLSADATLEAKREALEGGADSFLAKPIEAARLLEEVQSLVATSAVPDTRRAERPEPARPGAAAAHATVINLETLQHLEELGSSPAFLEKLVEVYVADNTSLLARIEQSLAVRNCQEVRAHLHAMKGSAASMGTDRLTRLCGALNALSDAEMRLQGPGLLRSLAEELAAARDALERYISERRSKSAG